MKKTLIPLLCFLFVSLQLFGQEGRIENLTIKTDEAITIDGLLTESIWQQAPEAEVFVQFNPNRQDPHKIKTSVKILYDDKYVYFGFLCHDTEPDEIKPGSITIDGDLRATDSVYVLIDLSSESTNYFYFATNYIGSKSDGIIIKGSRSVNYNWNGIWDSFSQKTDFGWSSEIAIELSSLFEESAENKSFGLSLARVVPRLEISIFQPNPFDAAFNMDEIRNLRVLNLFDAPEQQEFEPLMGQQLEEGKKAVITPFAVGKLEAGGKNSALAGLDALYIFSPNMFGQLAVYPDFDTVEPDFERINLTPFELYLPEKRSFFQGGSDTYGQPFRLFYSKRIGDIYGGVKLNGKSDVFEFSLLSAQGKKEEGLDEGSANLSVLSFKRTNLFNFVTIGFTAANKYQDKNNKGNTGVEAELKISDKFRFSGQFALSYGDYKKDNTAFSVGPSFDSTTLHIHLYYKQIGKYFGDNANEMGFIPDDNRKELDSAINKTFTLQSGFLERIRYRSNYNIYWGMDNTLRSWQIDEGLYFDTKKSFTLSVLHTMEYKLNEYYLEPKMIYLPEKGGWTELYTKEFQNYRTRFTSAYNAGEWQQFSLSITLGKNYGSLFQMFGISKKLQITQNLFSEYDLSHVRYHTESQRNRTFIHVLKLTINMMDNVSLKLLWQKNTIIHKTNYHVVVTYAFKPPFGTVQLIYQKGTAEFGVKGNQGSTFFLKLGYMF